MVYLEKSPNTPCQILNFISRIKQKLVKIQNSNFKMEYNTSTIESEMQNLLAARNNLRNLLSEEAPYTFDNEKIHLHNKIEEL